MRICKNEKISGAQMHFMCSINNGGKEYIKFCMSIVKIDICPENKEYSVATEKLEILHQ